MRGKRFFAACALLGLIWVLAAAQGGFGGAGGGRGGFGGTQAGFGGMQQDRNGDGTSVLRSIDDTIATYLDGPELKSILTPGDFCEWTLKLKAGQVVVAEARSEAFDPAIEMVDAKGKPLGSNDDRYPGDQRPLLLWRCEKDGDYALHVRCFHDRSGGQVFVRFKTFNCHDLEPGQKLSQETAGGTPFLLKIHMKAGEIKAIVSGSTRNMNAIQFRVHQIIASNGLPDIGLGDSIHGITGNTVVVAPVEGDYFALSEPFGAPSQSYSIEASTIDIQPKDVLKDGQGFVGSAKGKGPEVWLCSLKRGDFFRITTPDLKLGSQLVVADVPDFAKFDLSNPETNPFFPTVRSASRQPASFSVFPSRARDSRATVIYANRDSKVWVCSSGAISDKTEFAVHIQPAALPFPEQRRTEGQLRIGMTDYWSFDAKAGDVMTLESSTTGFIPITIVRDPDMVEIRHIDSALDQSSERWNMTVSKPGRYVVAVSCVGDGGAGTYGLSRNVFHAQTFEIGKPAKATIKKGEVQIWKFTANPEEPLLIHWASNTWSYDIATYDDKGQYASFEQISVDGKNRYGILKADQTQTYLLVITGRGAPATYSIELNKLLQAKFDK